MPDNIRVAGGDCRQKVVWRRRKTENQNRPNATPRLQFRPYGGARRRAAMASPRPATGIRRAVIAYARAEKYGRRAGLAVVRPRSVRPIVFIVEFGERPPGGVNAGLKQCCKKGVTEGTTFDDRIPNSTRGFYRRCRDDPTDFVRMHIGKIALPEEDRKRGLGR